MKKIPIYLLVVICICILLQAAGNETFTLTSWVERRNQEPLIKPTWEFVVTGTWSATDDSDTSGTIPVNGVLLHVALDVPTSKNSSSCEVEIYDNGDNKVFDTDDQPAGATYNYNLLEPFASEMNIYFGPSGAFGLGGGVITVTLRGI